MSTKDIVKQHHETFESIRHFDENGNEFWYARELAKVLEYSQYRHFQPVIDRSKEACRNSGYQEGDHFEDILQMVDIGSGAKRPVANMRLSRYACYLIVQNGDPTKSVIANGQTYFAMQTRRQELADDARFAQLTEDERRLMLRDELTHHNKALSAAAKDAGVETGLAGVWKTVEGSSYRRFFEGITDSGKSWEVGQENYGKALRTWSIAEDRYPRRK